MSRIGNKPISIPADLEVKFELGVIKVIKNNVTYNYSLPSFLAIQLQNDNLCLVALNNKRANLLGLHRSNINNFFLGIIDAFEVNLKLDGVGYRVALDEKYITFWVGFSHSIKYKIPNYISVKLLKSTEFFICGKNKCHINMIVSDICSIRKYDPYKGKGIYRVGQYLLKKEIAKK